MTLESIVHFIFILLNLLVDLVYVRLDPRVKLAGGRG